LLKLYFETLKRHNRKLKEYSFVEIALDPESLLEHYGMAIEDIIKTAHRTIVRKMEKFEKILKKYNKDEEVFR